MFGLLLLRRAAPPRRCCNQLQRAMAAASRGTMAAASRGTIAASGTGVRAKSDSTLKVVRSPSIPYVERLRIDQESNESETEQEVGDDAVSFFFLSFRRSSSLLTVAAFPHMWFRVFQYEDEHLVGMTGGEIFQEIMKEMKVSELTLAPVFPHASP